MNNRIKNAFDKIQAEESLKEHTREFLFQQTNGYQNRHRSFFLQWKRWTVAAACFIFVLLGAGGFGIYFTPTSAISIDINPSLELEINRFDKVISVTGYNSDGEMLAASLDIRYLNYNDALDLILNNQEILKLLSENEVLSITVTGNNEAQSSQILSDTQATTASDQNIYCHEGNSHEVETAHEAGMSFGKYQAFLQLQELDPSVTTEDGERMTMSEIQHRIRQLLERENNDPELNQRSSSASGGTSHQRNASGHDQGHHSEHGNMENSENVGNNRNNGNAGNNGNRGHHGGRRADS